MSWALLINGVINGVAAQPARMTLASRGARLMERIAATARDIKAHCICCLTRSNQPPSPLLLIHICAATVGLLSGFTTIFSAKVQVFIARGERRSICKTGNVQYSIRWCRRSDRSGRQSTACHREGRTFTRRRRSWYRGSVRRGSNCGALRRKMITPLRSSNARSSQKNAASFSPRAA